MGFVGIYLLIDNFEKGKIASLVEDADNTFFG
jgi:hypothetical protein